MGPSAMAEKISLEIEIIPMSEYNVSLSIEKKFFSMTYQNKIPFLGKSGKLLIFDFSKAIFRSYSPSIISNRFPE